MRKGRELRLAGIGRAALLLLLVAANVWAWPWSRDLVVQMITRPQQYATVPPPNSIPMGREVQVSRELARAQLRNPLTASPHSLEKGKALYETYCLVCHGPQGRGNGPVAGGAMLPADLTSERIRRQSDGELYHTIRHGLGSMPAYYERLKPEERWQVVLYIRTLTPPPAETRSARAR